MTRKILALSLILLFLLLATAGTSSVVNANGIPARPISKIYLRSDGNIEPSDAPIKKYYNVYTLTANLPNSTIIVECDNIVINGAGFILSGHGSHWYQGINLSDRKSITIKNFNIRDFSVGILILRSSFVTLTGNKINSAKCIEVSSLRPSSQNTNEDGNHEPATSIEILSYENQIIGNSLGSADLSFGYGIYGFATSNNTIKGNNFTNLDRCIGLSSGGYNVITENQFDRSGAGVYLDHTTKNIIYRNNFLGTGASTFEKVNLDNGKEGNYWSKYTGLDGNGDGIGDRPHWEGLRLVDNYPLINPVNLPFESTENLANPPASTPNESPSSSASPDETEQSIEPEPFPVMLIAFVCFVLAAVLAFTFLVYFKKGINSQIIIQ